MEDERLRKYAILGGSAIGYKRGVCFGVPSWDTLVHESLCDTVRLIYDLAP